VTRPVLADATADSNAISVLLGALGLFVGGLVMKGVELWKLRKEANRVSRADTIKEWSDLAERLKCDVKDLQTRSRERDQEIRERDQEREKQYRDMLKENADCIAHHERTEQKLDDANHRIAELTEELITLRVKTAKDTERMTHTVKTVAGLALDNAAGLAEIAAQVAEPPPDDAEPADVTQS
jgi:methyl-accepting chemotaxis protein